MESIYDLWRRSCTQNPERVALVQAGKRFTYQALDQLIDLSAQKMADAGVGACAKVALVMSNGPEMLIALFAAYKLGAVVCPLGANLTHREINNLIGLIEPDICISSFSTLNSDVLLDGVSPVLRFDETLHIVGSEHIEVRKHEPVLDGVALILCTSGTTGLPKAGMLTHANILLNLKAFHDLLISWPENEWLEHEVFGNIIPMSHPYGLIMMALMPLSLNGTVVLMPDFTPQSCLGTIEREGITFFGGVPSIYSALNKYRKQSQYDLSQCKRWISGGAALPEPVRSDFYRIFSKQINEGFGMLETASLSTLNFGDAGDHPGSLGPFSNIMEAQIRTSEGEILAVGDTGELWVAGSNVFKGYYKQYDESEGPSKWFQTGDLGRIDHDGHLYLEGRIKELMIVDGHNVFPTEIETVLLEFNGIVDAAVAAESTGARGDKIVAYLVVAEGLTVDQAAVLSHCREQLSAFKIPSKVSFVKEIPRNASGKIQRNSLLVS